MLHWIDNESQKKTADERTGIFLLITVSLLTEFGKEFWRSTGIGDTTKNARKVLDTYEKWLQNEDGYELRALEENHIEH